LGRRRSKKKKKKSCVVIKSEKKKKKKNFEKLTHMWKEKKLYECSWKENEMEKKKSVKENESPHQKKRGKWKRVNVFCDVNSQEWCSLILGFLESKEKQWFFVAQPHYKLNKVLSDPCLMTCLVILLGWMFESICCTHFARIELNTYLWAIHLWENCDSICFLIVCQGKWESCLSIAILSWSCSISLNIWKIDHKL
jgi:hypothetical protein